MTDYHKLAMGPEPEPQAGGDGAGVALGETQEAATMKIVVPRMIVVLAQGLEDSQCTPAGRKVDLAAAVVVRLLPLS